mgnify:CR=1 FL=1
MALIKSLDTKNKMIPTGVIPVGSFFYKNKRE